MRSGYIVLILALIVAVWRSQPPLPAGVDAPETAFSAARAMSDISAIAQKPHPVGSTEHARVQGYIVWRMNELGLAPRLQSTRSVVEYRGRTLSAPVTNVIGVLKGRNPNLPAVLVMSHYDTVPDSPGAADDSSGVATALEIARALKASGVPERDVIFLVTDGEEFGLLGAAAFFRHDPLAAHAGAVINFEARGDSGLASMFETGPRNGDAVALYAASAPRPAANSLARVLYKNMPNGTDLSVALEKNLPALNFAFIGDEAAYHSALATPAHLNLGSVQHMGDQALGAARAFSQRLPALTEDAVFADVLGFFLIQYPVWFGWVVLAVALIFAVFGLVAAQKAAPAGWLRGFGAALLVIAVPAAVLIGAGMLFGSVDHALRLGHFDYLLAGAGALATGLALAIAAFFARRKIRPAAVWQVLLILLSVASFAAQLLVAEAAFIFTWPVLIAGVMATLRYGILGGRDNTLSTLVCGALALVQLAMTIMDAMALFTAVGVDLPAVLMLPLLTALPVFLLLPQERPSTAVPVLLALAGLVLFAVGRFAGPSAAHPAPVTVRYVQDLDTTQAYRVAYFKVIDPWTEQALGAPREALLPWSENVKYWWAPAPSIAVPDTDVVILREGDKLRVAAQPRSGASLMTLQIRRDGASDHEYRIYAPDREGFSVVLPVTGRINVTVKTLYRVWPRAAQPLPSLPPAYMAFNDHAATVTVKRRSWSP
jgi:hypothetical protein